MSKHTKEQCFKLVGYPDWWNDNHKERRGVTCAAGKAIGGDGSEASANERIVPHEIGIDNNGLGGRASDVSDDRGNRVERLISNPDFCNIYSFHPNICNLEFIHPLVQKVLNNPLNEPNTCNQSLKESILHNKDLETPFFCNKITDEFVKIDNAFNDTGQKTKSKSLEYSFHKNNVNDIRREVNMVETCDISNKS